MRKRERVRRKCKASVIRAQRASYWMTMGDAGPGGWWGVGGELGSQQAARVAGRQAAVIRIISHTVACSSAHRQIFIGKIS